MMKEEVGNQMLLVNGDIIIVHYRTPNNLERILVGEVLHFDQGIAKVKGFRVAPKGTTEKQREEVVTLVPVSSGEVTVDLLPEMTNYQNIDQEWIVKYYGNM